MKFMRENLLSFGADPLGTISESRIDTREIPRARILSLIPRHNSVLKISNSSGQVRT